MREVVIVSGVRSPVGRYNGTLKNSRADELLAIVLKECVERVEVDKGLIDDVMVGCVTQVGEQAMNVARTASLMAGFPVTVPGVTIDRQCGSSQQAVHFASQAILAGDMDIVLAGGVESMTREPMFSNVGDVKQSNMLTEKRQIVNQGIAAELIADKWGMSREELDAFSLRSHARAIRAQAAGYFVNEIVPIKVAGRKVTVDEGPRKDTSAEKLAGLRAIFKKGGKITAGNASQISDGASAVLLMSAEKARALGVKARFKVVARTVVGSDPTLMLTGPIAATKQVLEQADLQIGEIDLFEVNEAFASVPLAWLKETGVELEKVNVNGGAIALGHPLGATGTKLLVSLMAELERTGGKYGLVTICEGMGMANATIIERI